MKHINFIILSLLVSMTPLAYGQQDQSLDNYNEGLRMFNQGNYRAADSLFTLSVNLSPHPDTYYNLALTKHHLLDTCGFCNNLKAASAYGDAEAWRLFILNCSKYDTIKYTEVLYKDTLFYSVKTTSICSSEKSHQYFLKDFNSGKITSFFINDNSSSKANKKKEVIKETPVDIKKLPAYSFVCDIVDQLPQFPGGESSRIRFLTDNLKYPQEAKENGIQGTVYLELFIDSGGQIVSINVLKGIGGGCDEESVRVCRLMPKWVPAFRNNLPVSVHFQIPVKYTLN